VYIDVAGRGAVAIGWVFRKRMRYDDCDEVYLRDVWVTLHADRDTVTRTPHYLDTRGKTVRMEDRS
jgi:hypothetical protein